MDARRLKIFLAVVDEGGVTRAAAKLRIAQPSLSQALRAIEREYGTELFHRTGRGLTITPSGEALVGPARQALRSLETAAAAVAQVSGLQAGRLDIAVLSMLAANPLASLIGGFRRNYPSVAVRVREEESIAALNALVSDGSCEIGLTDLIQSTRELTSTLLGEQELLFALPPGTTGANRPLPISALAEIPLVVAPTGTSTRRLLDQALASVGVEPVIAVEGAPLQATVGLVLAGAGAALVARQTAEYARGLGAVVRPPQPKITQKIGLIFREEQLTPAGRAFLEEAAGSPVRRPLGQTMTFSSSARARQFESVGAFVVRYLRRGSAMT